MAWGLIRAQDQFALVFTYVDHTRGPSAKGARVRGTEPGPEDARDACERPNVTVRIEPGLRVRPLSPEQYALLALPEAPPWLVHVGKDWVEKPAPAPPPPEDHRGALVIIVTVVVALATALLSYLYFFDD